MQAELLQHMWITRIPIPLTDAKCKQSHLLESSQVVHVFDHHIIRGKKDVINSESYFQDFVM